MNTMVAIGKITKNGMLKVASPIQLTNLVPEFTAWNTAVAINRTNSNNIIVSWELVSIAPFIGTIYRAVSFDGGANWQVNPLNIQPIGVHRYLAIIEAFLPINLVIFGIYTPVIMMIQEIT